MATRAKYLLVFLCFAFVASDEIDIELNRGTAIKFLKAMSNTTNGDTLNLPANSTSIRENITDTFSCENRTYGYYADVDNDCQIFHVCLPSQTPSGRNVTYKWSFICPAETIFNQEVLVCTRPLDAIPCEDSPMYYDINMEFGKVIDDKDEETDPKKETAFVEPKPNMKRPQSRRPINRKQNIIVEELMKEVIDDKVDKELNEMGYEDVGVEEIVPILVDNENETNVDEDKDETPKEDVEERLVEERSMKWSGRKMGRGVFRFQADV